MRESPHPRVELEIATVRATRRPVPQALEEVLKRVDEAHALLRQPGVVTGAVAAPAQASLLPEATTSGARPAVEPRRAALPSSPPPRPSTLPPPTPPVDAELATAWERVVDEVMKKKPMLGATLTQAQPGGVRDRELVIVLTGNHFHREMLADNANRDLIVQAARRYIPGVERISVEAPGAAAGGLTEHPAVQAAIAEFQGEVVAVRRHLPEGEGQ